MLNASSCVWIPINERVRCANCTTKIQPWLPKASQRACCASGGARKAEVKRREDYPKRLASAKRMVCARYQQTGVCLNMERLGWCQFHHPLPDKIVQLDFEGPSRCRFCTLPLPCNVHFPKIGSIIDDPRFTPLLVLETEEKHAETDAHQSDEIEAQSTEKQASLQKNKNVKARKMTMRSSVKLAAQKKKKPRATFKTNEIVAAFHQNTWRYAYLLEENLNSGMLTLALKANAKPPSNTVLLVREKVRSLRGIIFETKTQSDAPAKDMISTSLTTPSASEASV